jgi:hypothetical protein
MTKQQNPNLALWERVFVTDPQAVKPITGKPYKGNSPKPYWLIWRATQEFGPCGEGWGVEVKSESFYRMTDTDVMHSAVVVVWYMKDGKRCQVEQMGQTKACYAKSGGGMVVDEDAGKKSITDGMVKCLSMIGFAGDIFSGRWDDSGYVQWAAEQYAPPPATITEEQASKIEALIAEVGADKVQFLAWVAQMSGAEVVETGDIPEAAAAPAMRALEKKRAKGKAKPPVEHEDVPY